jgi:hypothetical protein
MTKLIDTTIKCAAIAGVVSVVIIWGAMIAASFVTI